MPEEVVVADRQPQRVQRHRAADVDRRRRTGGPGPGRRSVSCQNGSSAGMHVVQEVEVLLRPCRGPRARSTATRRRSRSPRSARCAATRRRARLSPNHWWASSWTTTRVAAPRVGRRSPARRSGRVWFSSAKPRPVDVVDDAAGRVERVGAELAGQEVDDLRLAGERRVEPCSPTRAAACRRRCRRSSRSRCRGCPPAAPGTVQPSSVSPSSSNEVVPSPVETHDVVDERRRRAGRVVAGVG